MTLSRGISGCGGSDVVSGEIRDRRSSRSGVGSRDMSGSGLLALAGINWKTCTRDANLVAQLGLLLSLHEPEGSATNGKEEDSTRHNHSDQDIAVGRLGCVDRGVHKSNTQSIGRGRIDLVKGHTLNSLHAGQGTLHGVKVVLAGVILVDGKDGLGVESRERGDLIGDLSATLEGDIDIDFRDCGEDHGSEGDGGGLRSLRCSELRAEGNKEERSHHGR